MMQALNAHFHSREDLEKAVKALEEADLAIDALGHLEWDVDEELNPMPNASGDLVLELAIRPDSQEMKVARTILKQAGAHTVELREATGKGANVYVLPAAR
jgi:hypothetical protein